MSFDLQKYFERIGYSEQPNVSIETLKKIHVAQLFSIPFENLSIHELKNINNSHDFISLKEDDLFQKLVLNKRGGYCHENNELLAIALTRIGFKVERLAARVLTAENLPIGHKLLLVTINDNEEKWLADVGFGGYGLFEPIPLRKNEQIKQYGDIFQLTMEKDKYLLRFFEDRETWKNLYEFDLKVFEPHDFAQMSFYISHFPDSFFVKNIMCVSPSAEGRIILFNDDLKIIKDNQVVRRETIPEGKLYLSKLEDHFRITLPENTVLKKLQK